MKLRILSLYLFLLLTEGHVFSQWVQTNGPYGPVNAKAFFTFDSLNYLATRCGIFSSQDINVTWNLETALDIEGHLILDDSIFIASTTSGLSIFDLTIPGFDPQPFGSPLGRINAVANSDSCLYTGTDYGGFYKFTGFSDELEWLNTGLPVDSGIIPPKFGGGK